MSVVQWPTPHDVSDSAEPAAGRKGWLASLSVRVKVLLAVALTAVTTLGVATVGLYEMNRLNNDSQTVTDGNVARLIQVAELRQAITQMQVNGILVQFSPPEQAATFHPLYETALTNVNERFTAYRAAGLTDRRWVAGVDRFAGVWTRINVALAEISKLDPADPAVLAAGVEIGRLMDELDTVVTDLTGSRTRFGRSRPARTPWPATLTSCAARRMRSTRTRPRRPTRSPSPPTPLTRCRSTCRRSRPGPVR